MTCMSSHCNRSARHCSVYGSSSHAFCINGRSSQAFGKCGRSSRAFDCNGRSSRALATIATRGNSPCCPSQLLEAAPPQSCTAFPPALRLGSPGSSPWHRALTFSSNARTKITPLTQDPTFKESNVASPKQCLQSDLADSGTDMCVSNPGLNAVALPHGLFTPALPRT